MSWGYLNAFMSFCGDFKECTHHVGGFMWYVHDFAVSQFSMLVENLHLLTNRYSDNGFTKPILREDSLTTSKAAATITFIITCRRGARRRATASPTPTTAVPVETKNMMRVLSLLK